MVNQMDNRLDIDMINNNMININLLEEIPWSLEKGFLIILRGKIHGGHGSLLANAINSIMRLTVLLSIQRILSSEICTCYLK